ncbi:MAG: quinol:cytochrome C oxidoreductase [Planctomyces sp.]
MSQLSASAHDHDHGHAHAGHAHPGHHGHGEPPSLAADNTEAPKGWGSALMGLFIVAGLACAGATLASGFILGGADEAAQKTAIKHGLASYHVGALVALGMALGPLGLVLIMNLVKAGWFVTLRRQAENAASLVWLGVIMLLPPLVIELLKPGVFIKWRTPGLIATDELLAKKAPYLNDPFFFSRLAVYAIVWIIIARLIVGFSRKQDITGDKWLSNKASFHSAWAILAFALTCAFASFDLIKALDFHWFSTMFGVYFFAGNMLAGLSILVVILAALRSSGRLKGLVTAEHFHDTGKLMFAFTVFWAYISFSQYFLYWYANIPEETGWFMARQSNGWQYLFYALCIGHFIVPFLILIWRDVKKSTILLAAMGVFMLVMHILDVFYQIRPLVYMTKVIDQTAVIPGKVGLGWMDFTGALGPVLIFIGVLIWKVRSAPLIPIKDPRLPEALEHKNYV